MAIPKAQSSEARDRVLNSAYTLFVQSGYTDVSMQQIADASAITKATLYHHFRDKQELYIETMRLAIDRSQCYFRDNLNDSDDLREVMRALVNYHFGVHKTDMQRLASDFKRYVDQETQEQFWQQYEQPWEFFYKPLAHAIERGEIIDSDLETLARYLFGAIAGITMTQYIHRKRSQPDLEEIDLFIDLLLRGVAPVIPTAPILD